MSNLNKDLPRSETGYMCFDTNNLHSLLVVESINSDHTVKMAITDAITDVALTKHFVAN